MDQKLSELTRKRTRLTRELIKVNRVIASYNPNKKRLEMKENLDALRDVVPDFNAKVERLTADKKVSFNDKDEFMKYFSEHPDEWDELLDKLENFE